MNTTQSPLKFIDRTQLPPAQLWIGGSLEIVPHAIAFLQSIFCKHNGCTTCHTCHAIRMQQHHAIIWLHPEKQYTLESIAIIGQTISFALEPGHHHFFIIQKADALTPACSNSLLKSIEEPPQGYHFMLLTDRPNDLLPTIRSRCVEQTFGTVHENATHQNLFTFFTGIKSATPATFLKELELSKIGERESLELLDRLLAHWIKLSNQALIEGNIGKYRHTQAILAIIKKALLIPPMPGGSNLLWKDLFLSMEHKRHK